MNTPSESAAYEAIGRLPSGKFGKGNKFAKGNPNARKVASLRQALLGAVKPSDLREIVQALVQQAKSGDLNAAREVMDRLLGKAPASVSTSIDLTTTTREADYSKYGGLSQDKLDRLADLDELIHKPIPVRDNDDPPDPCLTIDTPTDDNDGIGALRLSA